MDIKAPDFADSFNKEEARVGIVGMGSVGKSVKSYFDRYKIGVLPYDRYESGYKKINDVVKDAHIIFVTVDAPITDKRVRNVDTIIESIDLIEKAAGEVGRPTDTFIVCVMSPSPPGFTKSQRNKRVGMRIVSVPEFLSEKSVERDLQHTNRFIVGGDMDDARIVLQFFLECDRRRVEEGKCVLVQCDSTTAELTRIFVNGILSSKAAFSKEMSKICSTFSCSFEEVRVLSALDQRVGASFTKPEDGEDKIVIDDFIVFNEMQNSMRNWEN